MEEDEVSVGKFTGKFMLWFVVYVIITNLLFSIIGNFISANVELVYISIITNSIVLLASVILSIRLAIQTIIKKNRITVIEIPKFLKIVGILFFIIAVLEIGMKSYRMNNSYTMQAEKIMTELIEEKYQEADEVEKQKLEEKKQKAIQQGKNQVNIYMAILGTLEIIIYLSAIPYTKKILEEKMTFSR